MVVEGLAAKWAINIAVEGTKRLLEEGSKILAESKEGRADILEACDRYLQAAATAVSGLEAEVDEILHEAALISNAKGGDLSHLWERIDLYLHNDHLRRKLESSIGGLGGCLEVLEALATERATANVRQKRQLALVDLDAVIRRVRDYEQSLERFEANGLRHLPAGTGIAAWELSQIKLILNGRDSLDEPSRQAVSRLVDEARSRSKESFKEIIRGVEQPRVTLRPAFR
jgi:hypothetical protein